MIQEEQEEQEEAGVSSDFTAPVIAGLQAGAETCLSHVAHTARRSIRPESGLKA